MRLILGTFIAQMTERNRAMCLTQVEVWWSVGVNVPEGVRPSPANTEQLRMNVLRHMACPQTPYIAYACVTDVRIVYSVVTKYPSATAHQIRHSQILPGYPHSSAGAYGTRCTNLKPYTLPSMSTVGGCTLSSHKFEHIW